MVFVRRNKFGGFGESAEIIFFCISCFFLRMFTRPDLDFGRILGGTFVLVHFTPQ